MKAYTRLIVKWGDGKALGVPELERARFYVLQHADDPDGPWESVDDHDPDWLPTIRQLIRDRTVGANG